MALPWTDSMSTSEHRAVDAESDLPLSAAELSALASQLYAASIRPGFDSPPQSAPVAPRGNVPDTTAAPSTAATAGGIADPFVPADLSAFAVPTEGIVPTLPGVLAGGVPTVPVAPRGSAPSWPTGAPSVPELGWTDTLPAGPNAPAGAEGTYHLLTPTDPVPHLTDDHEIFDVNAVRADFPILKEVINGKPLIWFDNAAPTQKPEGVIDGLGTFSAP